jgi:hypothetical protein
MDRGIKMEGSSYDRGRKEDLRQRSRRRKE